jgi:hypothetical protein
MSQYELMLCYVGITNGACTQYIKKGLNANIVILLM